MQENIENSPKQSAHQTQIESALDYTITPSMLHDILLTIWPRELEDDDLELLDVSLYHLFYNLNLLLQEILPQLAEISVEAEATTQHIRIQRHKIWLWLNEIKHRLERIEPLCQIIIITITHILTAIDANEPNMMQKSYQQTLFSQTQQKEQHEVLTLQEYTYYTKCLCTWQELNLQSQKLQAFRHLFADIPEGHDLLTRIDSMLIELYQSAQIIFSSLLQQDGSNPSILLRFLLDLQQHTDLLQIQIDMLLTPLYKLREQVQPFPELRQSLQDDLNRK